MSSSPRKRGPAAGPRGKAAWIPACAAMTRGRCFGASGHVRSIVPGRRCGDRQIGQPLELLAPALDQFQHQAAHQGQRRQQHQTRSPARRWAGAGPGRCAGTPAPPVRPSASAASSKPVPLAAKNSSGRASFTSVVMVRRMRSPSAQVCSFDCDPDGRGRVAARDFRDRHLQFQRVHGELGLGLEAARQRREGFDEAAGERAIAGQHVGDASAEHAAHDAAEHLVADAMAPAVRHLLRRSPRAAVTMSSWRSCSIRSMAGAAAAS